MHNSIVIYFLVFGATVWGQDINYPQLTAEKEGLKGPVKTVYEMKYTCDNYVEFSPTERVTVTQFLKNTKIEFKEFYRRNKIYLRLEYSYKDNELSRLSEDHRQDEYFAHKDYIYNHQKKEKLELSYLENRLYLKLLYKEGMLFESENYDGDLMQHRTRYDLEDGLVHHINHDEYNKSGKLQMRWETDFTYENNRLKRKMHFTKDYIYYKEVYAYREDKSLREIICTDHTLDTTWIERYNENNQIIWQKKNTTRNGETIYTTFEYNKNNQIISRKSSSMFENDSSWTYDLEGNLIAELATRDNEKVSESTWEYANGKKVKLTHKGNENRAVIYTYDSNGNWIKEVRTSQFGVTNVLLRRIYYYD